jgi:hypothetical protein
MSSFSIQRVLRTLRHAAPALAIAGTAVSASAGTTATLDTGPLAIQIVDLRPDDGVAAALTFDDIADSSALGVEAVQMHPTAEELKLRYGSWRNDINLTASTDASSVSGFIGGGGANDPAGVSISFRGQTLGFTGPPDAAAGFSAEGALTNQGNAIDVILAPWTQVVVRMDVSAELAALHDGDTASADLQMYFNGSDDQRANDEFHLDCVGPCHAMDGRTVTITFANASDAVYQGNLGVYGSIEGLAFAAPVPEPASGALMLAGVAVLFAGTRRVARQTDRAA